MGGSQVCYDIEGNIAPCADVLASGATAQPLTASDLASLSQTGGTLYVGGAPGTSTLVGIPASSLPGLIGSGSSGGNSSALSSAGANSNASGIAAAINSVFGSVYSATHPAKQGQVINPATGQPYSLGQQLQLSGLFSNPLLLIVLIVAAIFAFRGTGRHEG